LDEFLITSIDFITTSLEASSGGLTRKNRGFTVGCVGSKGINDAFVGITDVSRGWTERDVGTGGSSTGLCNTSIDCAGIVIIATSDSSSASSCSTSGDEATFSRRRDAFGFFNTSSDVTEGDSARIRDGEDAFVDCDTLTSGSSRSWGCTGSIPTSVSLARIDLGTGLRNCFAASRVGLVSNCNFTGFNR